MELSAANAHDITEAVWLMEAIPPVAGRVGRPRRIPDRLYADGAYDSKAFRNYLRGRGIEPHIPHRLRRKEPGVGKIRWVGERTVAWLHQFKRLQVRHERRDDIHEAFLNLACAVLCWRALRRAL